MKKFVKSVLAIAMVVVLGIGITGCAKISNLLPELKGGYSFSIDKINTLSSTTRYDWCGSNGKYVCVRDSYGKYKVIDVEKDEEICSSKNEIAIIDNGLFAWYDQSEENYSVYVNGNTSVYSDGAINTTNHTFVDASNLARIYVDVNGKVKTENNPFAKILTYSDSYVKMGDNYVQSVDGGFEYSNIYNVFDKEGKYVRTCNLTEMFGWSADERQGRRWFIDDTVFVQTERMLAEDAKDYDYIYNGGKYELTTYSYNVSNNNVKVLKDFNYSVSSVQYSSDKMAVLSVHKIENKKIDMAQYAQSFKKDGDIYVDLQDIVPGAKRFEVIDEKYSHITDAVGDVHIFKENEKLMVIPSEQAYNMNIVGSYAYVKEGEELYLFDLEKNGAMSKIEYVQGVSKYDSKIIYVQNNQNYYVNRICMFDTNTKNTKTYDLDSKETAVLYGDFVAVSKKAKMEKLVFCAGEDFVEEFAENSSIVTTSYDSKKGVDYVIFRLAEDITEDEYSYKVMKYTYPTKK